MATRYLLIAVSMSVLGLATLACSAPSASPTAAPKVASPVGVATPAPAPPSVAPTAAPTKAPAREGKSAIRLGYLTNYFTAATVIGMQEKFFEQEGLAMTYEPFSLGRNALQALVGGAIDIAPVATVPMITGSAGAPIVSIGIVAYNPGSQAVVVKKDSAIKQVGDLRGKKIGSPVGTAIDYVLREKYLPSFGLRQGDYQVVNMDTPNMMGALTTGNIDAFVASDPYPMQAVETGIGTILTDLGAADPVLGLYAAQRSFVEANPNTIVKFMKGHMRSTKLMKDDFPKASRMMREFMAARQLKLTQESADLLMSHVDPTPFYMPKLAEYLDEWAQHEKSLGNITTVPDWNKVLLTEFQDRAAAELGIKNPYK